LAVDAKAQEKVKAALSQLGLTACFLGEFTKNKQRALIKTGKETFFPQIADDPYALILSGK